MADITVKAFAQFLGIPLDRLILHLRIEGYDLSNESDLVTEQQQRVIRGYIESEHAQDTTTVDRATNEQVIDELSNTKNPPAETKLDDSDESNGDGPHLTILDISDSVTDEASPTVVDVQASQDSSGEPLPSQRQERGWLPGALASRYTIESEFDATGSEADVYLVRDATNSRYCAKIYRKSRTPNEEILAALASSPQQHTIGIREYGESDGYWYELLEYAPFGSVRDLINAGRKAISQDDVFQILQQTASALSYIHSLNIECRDLKPANILVLETLPLNIVLADFGISSQVDATLNFTTSSRTEKYAPPESHTGTIYRTRWDYWSLGMTLVELITGRHPFDDVDERAVARRLATMNTSELAESVADPQWHKLCQGLLRRDPELRWGEEEVQKWIMNPADPTLVVAEDLNVRQERSQPFRFLGVNYYTAAEVAAAFSDNWDEAKEVWRRQNQDQYSRDICDWLRHEVGDVDAANDLERIDKLPGADIDAQVFSIIHRLDPERPLSFKGYPLTVASLAKLADEAGNDSKPAMDMLHSLYKSEILIFSEALNNTDGRELGAIAGKWLEAVGDYRQRLEKLDEIGVDVAELDEHRLIEILVWASREPSSLNSLRVRAKAASSRDALECEWFRGLGRYDQAPVSALLLIPDVAKQATFGAEQRRYDNAVQKYGVFARWILGFGIGTLSGAITAYIPGFIVYWLIASFSSDRTATTSSIFWVLACGLFGALYQWTNAEKLVGNSQRSLAMVIAQGAFWGLTGVIGVGVVLYVSVPSVLEDYKTFDELSRREALNCTSNDDAIRLIGKPAVEITLCKWSERIILYANKGIEVGYSSRSYGSNSSSSHNKPWSHYATFQAPMTYPGSIAWSWRVFPNKENFEKSGIEFIRLKVRAKE